MKFFRKVIFLLFISLISCNKDEEYFGPVYLGNDSIEIDNISNRLLIGCEGNFQYGNASLSLLNLDSSSVQNGVYAATNQKALGDVFQSMLVVGDTLICVLNNSNQLKLLDLNSFVEIAVVENIPSPRYLESTDRGSILVTSLYGNKIVEIDLASLEVINEVSIYGWTERIFKIGTQYFIANIDSNCVLVMTEEFVIKDTIKLNFSPTYADTSGSLLAISGQENSESFIAIINTQNQDFKQNKLLNSSGVSIDKLGVYVLNGNSVQVLDYSLINQITLFEHELLTPYGFHLDKKLNRFYITDAIDYISKGKVYSYDREGVKLLELESGIIPQSVISRF